MPKNDNKKRSRSKELKKAREKRAVFRNILAEIKSRNPKTYSQEDIDILEKNSREKLSGKERQKKHYDSKKQKFEELTNKAPDSLSEKDKKELTKLQNEKEKRKAYHKNYRPKKNELTTDNTAALIAESESMINAFNNDFINSYSGSVRNWFGTFAVSDLPHNECDADKVTETTSDIPKNNNNNNNLTFSNE